MPIVNPDEQCDFKLAAEEIWVQRRRKNGKPFMLRLVVGERCPNAAVVTKFRDGKRRHRCFGHLGADWQD